MQSESRYANEINEAIAMAIEDGCALVYKEHVWLTLLASDRFEEIFDALKVDRQDFEEVLKARLESLKRFNPGSNFTKDNIPFSPEVQEVATQLRLLADAEGGNIYPSQIFYSMIYQPNDGGSRFISKLVSADELTVFIARELEREKTLPFPKGSGQVNQHGHKKDWFETVSNDWFQENLMQVRDAFDLSIFHTHASVKPEHIWCSFLDSPEFSNHLSHLGVNVDELQLYANRALHSLPLSTNISTRKVEPSKEVAIFLENIEAHSFQYEENFGAVWLLSLMLDMEDDVIGKYLTENYADLYQNMLKYSPEGMIENKVLLNKKNEREMNIRKRAMMQVEFDEKAVQSLHPITQKSVKIAYEHGHSEVKPVHLWHILLESEDFAHFITRSEIDFKKLREKVNNFIDKEPTSFFSAEDGSEIPMPKLTEQVVEIDKFAREYAAENGRQSTNYDILNALFTPEGNKADRTSKFAVSLGMKPEIVEAYTSRGLIEYMRDNSGVNDNEIVIFDKQAALKERLMLRKQQIDLERKALEKTPLGETCDNLVWQAVNGKIDPIIGVEEKMEEVIQTLAQYKKPNVMVLAEPGVGKTALAEGLALKIANGDVPDWMLDKRIYSLSVSNLAAGTRYRGDMEERIEKMVEQLSGDDNAILFIDEVHMLNSQLSGDSKIADALKPALSRGAFKCIGATTFNEYRKIAEDGALMRRFQNVYLDEPSAEITVEILKNGLQKTMEDHHNVTLGDGLIEECVSLADRYIMSRFFPDKAIDVLDKACAIVKCRNNGSESKVIVEKELARESVEVLTHVKIPDGSLDEAQRALDLEDNLKNVIFGQDHAIDAVCKAEIIRTAGFKDPDKPNGAYVFDGPTGVGKTELTKQLGKILERPVKRFDMSEFMEKHSVAKLIGTNPGYVGYEQGGLLTDAVEREPNMILLLDEVEKAHPDIYNVLLQVLDHGKLTDGHGKTVDFRNVTIIMTTNLSKKVEPEKGMGFGNHLVKKPDVESGDSAISGSQGVNKFFSPEFRNRLDAVVSFNDLTDKIMPLIANKTLSEAGAIFKGGGLTAEFTQSAVNAVVKNGANKAMGARPMKRYVKDNIIEPMALAKLKKEFSEKVLVDFVDGKFTFSETREAANDTSEGKITDTGSAEPLAPKAM